MDVVNNYFPQVHVLKRGEEQKPNLGPVICRSEIPNNAGFETAVTLLRLAQTKLGVTRLANALGQGVVETGSVLPYQIGFGKLRQLLPIGQITSACEDSKLGQIGWIPVSEQDAPELDGWHLKHALHCYTDSGAVSHREIINRMQREGKGLDTMGFWMQPYIPSGLEFSPARWFANFDFSFGCLRESQRSGPLFSHTDSASVNVEFTPITQDGAEKLYPSNFRFKFKRQYHQPERTIEFTSGNFGWSSKPAEPTLGDLTPTAVPQGERFGIATLERITTSKNRGNKPVRYEDLVAVEMFPNLDGGQYRRVNEPPTLARLVTIFEGGDFDALDGFGWVQFT